MRGPASVSERGPLNGGNRHGAVVPRDQRQRFFFRQSDREHRSFAASAVLHESRAQRDNPAPLLRKKKCRRRMPPRFRRRYGRRSLPARRPTISKAPRAPPASRKWPAAQSPSDAFGTFPRSGRVLRAARSSPRDASRHRSASIASRKTGSCCIRSRPMPHHCGPWPLMTKPMRGALLPARRESRADLWALFFLRERVEFLDQFGPIEATSVSRCG